MMKLFLAGFVVMGSSMSWWAWQQDPAPVGEAAPPISAATTPQDTPPATATTVQGTPPAVETGNYRVFGVPPGQRPGVQVPQEVIPVGSVPGWPVGAIPSANYYRFEERVVTLPDGTKTVVQTPSRQSSDPTAVELHNTMQKYREAGEGSPERDTLRTEIGELLGKQYDHHLSQHEQQVVELESRLAKLREQLDRRQAAKGKLVELKLEMVLSQAEGLGWPESPQTAGAYYLRPLSEVPAGTPIYSSPADAPGVRTLVEGTVVPGGAAGRNAFPVLPQR